MFDIKYLLRYTAIAVFALTLLTPSSAKAETECQKYKIGGMCWPPPPRCMPKQQGAIVDAKPVIYQHWDSIVRHHARNVTYLFVVSVPVYPYGMVDAGYSVCTTSYNPPPRRRRGIQEY